MKKRAFSLLLAGLIFLLAACGKAPNTAKSADDQPLPQTAGDVNDAPVETAETDTEPGRQDGERFEEVIILEGEEETVSYEHVKNEALGFEMDFEYESLVRHSEADRERFISIWDDPEDPWNYLEVTRSAEDAETAAAAVRESLSQAYELYEETYELDRAGNCLYMEAFEQKDTGRVADQLQAVYIVPASDGCIVATAHFSMEAAEGFGRRFDYMMQTLTVIDG